MYDDEIKFGRWIAGTVGCLAIMGGLISSCETIDSGERGVKVTWGKVDENQILTEGLNFKIPIMQKIVPYSIRTQKLEMKTAAFTKDIQNVQLDMVVNYSIDPNAVTKIYKQYGTNVEELVIKPTILDEVKNDLGKWEAAQLVENREKSSTTIEERLRAELAKKHIKVIDFRYRDIDFSDEFERAIEEKVTAGQKVLTERNRSAQEEEKSRQAVIRAEAEAKKIGLMAKANADATKIQAEAEAEALRLKSSALTDNVLILSGIERWNGQLPQVITGNSGQILDLKGIMNQQKPQQPAQQSQQPTTTTNAQTSVRPQPSKIACTLAKRVILNTKERTIA